MPTYINNMLYTDVSMGRFDPVRDLQDLSGKVAIVTGATHWVTTAQQLLRKGAIVYLAARNEEKAKNAIDHLTAEGLGPGKGKPVFHRLSLDDPRDAKASAEAFLEREKRLDILINNAATFLMPHKTGAFGLDNDIIVNQFSPFVFTKVLLPLMKKTAFDRGADVRIVNVGSTVHDILKEARFSSRDDLNVTYEGENYSSLKRYAHSKLAVMLWTKELARRLAVSSDDGGSRIIVMTLHPGGTSTEGLNAMFPVLFPRILSWAVSLFIRLVTYTPTEGAFNTTFAAGSPKVRQEPTKYNGAYLVPVQKVGKPSKLAQNESLAKDLWELQESILTEEGI